MPTLLDPGLASINDTDGSIGVGWKLNFYVTGTSTRKNTYPTVADANASTNANANPVIISADGRIPPIWLRAGDYKCVLTDENDVVKETLDPVAQDFSVDFGSYATRDAIQALSAASGMRVYLTESGREGAFVFSSSDLSAYVTADPGEGVYLAPDSAPTGSSGAWVRQHNGSLFLKQFGATGDGLTDDITAVNRCFAVARLLPVTVFIETGTFRVTSNVFVYNGVRRIIGLGGEIKLDQSSGAASFVLATTGGAHVNDCLVEGVTLNTNAKQTLGFYGQNTRRCTFRRNYIYGLTNTTQAYAFFLKSFYTGAHAASHNLIENNRIEGETTHGSHADGQISIVVSGDWTTPYNGYADLSAEWKATFTNIVPTQYAEDNVVRNNIVNGGRYGIEVIGSKNTTVEGNVFKSNTRAISLQGRSGQNIIRGNHIIDTLATGVGMSYVCSDNLIDGNTVITSVANSLTEGVLFATVGCLGNTFQNNKVTVTGAAGPAYMLYAAIHASGNVFRNNQCEGPVQRCYMAVESAWDNAETNTSHRAQGGGASLNNFANAPTTQVSFMGNEIDADSAEPCMFIGQFAGAGMGLTYVNVSGNRFRGSYSAVIEIEETNASQVNNCTFYGNVHPSTSTSAFILSVAGRGYAHFTVFDDPKLVYTATYDPASINSTLSVSTTITVTGVAIGDVVIPTFSLDLAGIVLSGYVSAANTVTVVFANPTAGAVDLASGTLSVRVKRA